MYWGRLKLNAKKWAPAVVHWEKLASVQRPAVERRRMIGSDGEVSRRGMGDKTSWGKALAKGVRAASPARLGVQCVRT